MSQTRERIALCRAEELAPGERRIAAAAGTEVGVFNLGDRFVAYRNLCPHQGAPVCLGRVGGTTLPSSPGEYVFGLHGRVLTCPWHGWQFDLESGRALSGRERLAPIDVAVEDGVVVLYVKKRRER